LLSERLQSSIHSAASPHSVHIQATPEETAVVEHHASVSWAAAVVRLEDPLTVDCRTGHGHSSPCQASVVMDWLVIEGLEIGQRLRSESSQGQDEHSRRI
jgi:hypothetical protein